MSGSVRPARLPVIVFTALITSLALVWLEQVRLGVLVLSAALCTAAALRWAVPPAKLGTLVSRSRVTDVISSGVLGLALGVLGFLLPQ